MFVRTAALIAIMIIPSGSAFATRSLIHLTFDDGPHPSRTPRLLQVLKQANVKATFFVTGAKCLQHPQVLKQIVMDGHSLGNHTQNHPNLRGKQPDQIKAELDATQAAVDQALLPASAIARGKHFPMRTFRPPGGSLDNNVRAVVSSLLTPAAQVLKRHGKLPDGVGGTKVVLWNVDSNDWRKQGVDAVMGHVFPAVYASPTRAKVILFHDIHAQTVDQYFPPVLRRLLDEGFTIERLDRVKGYMGL